MPQESKSMKTVEVVGAVIWNSSGEVLCALRSEQMSHSHLWEFPGGKVEKGESPKEALTREIEEELHCRIEVGSFIMKTSHRYPSIHVKLSLYHASNQSGSFEAKEHSRLLWLPPTALSSLSWAPADIPVVELLISGGCKKPQF